MNTILVPTNLSTASKNAAEYAGHLCRAWSCKMLLYNVVMLPVPVADLPYSMEGADEIQEEFEKVLAMEAQRLFEMFDIEIAHTVEVGIPEFEIGEVAREKDADLIVMGMQHKDGLDKILGSTVNAVARKSTIPLLVVPEEAVFTNIRSITYATDLSYQLNPLTFRPLIKIVDSFKASLNLLHVQKPDDIVSQEDIAGKIKLTLATEGLIYQYHTIEDDDVEHGIEQFLQQNPSDILAMTAHKHSFLERLFGKKHTKSMVNKTTIPLLVLHDAP